MNPTCPTCGIINPPDAGVCECESLLLPALSPHRQSLTKTLAVFGIAFLLALASLAAIVWHLRESFLPRC
jgi:hypothetical protein